MPRLVSIAAATLKDLSPAETVSVAASAGFGGSGIWFDPDTWNDSVAREVRARLGDSGVVALDIEPVIFSDTGDPGERLIDAAAAIGARYVLVASRLADLGAVTERFAALCERASPAGITLVLEFLPIFAVANLADAVGVVRAAAQANSGVLVDSLHLARSGGSPSDVAGLPGDLFPYIQVADAPLEPPDRSLAGLRDEALSGRSLPGQGALPLAELVDAVPGVPLSAELRSSGLFATYPDPLDRARAVLAACQPLAER
jgi:sugar phosphate isomerase/epimerase